MREEEIVLCEEERSKDGTAEEESAVRKNFHGLQATRR